MMGNWFRKIGHWFKSGFKGMLTQSNSASATATVKAHGEVNGAKLEGHYQNNSQHTNNSKHQKWNDKRHKKIVNKQHKRSSRHSTHKSVDKHHSKSVQKASNINNYYGNASQLDSSSRTQQAAPSMKLAPNTERLVKIMASADASAAASAGMKAGQAMASNSLSASSRVSQADSTASFYRSQNASLRADPTKSHGAEIPCSPEIHHVYHLDDDIIAPKNVFSPDMNAAMNIKIRQLGKSHYKDIQSGSKPLQFRSNLTKNKDLKAFPPLYLHSYGLDTSSGMSSLYGKSAGSSEDSSSSSSSASSESDQPDL